MKTIIRLLMVTAAKVLYSAGFLFSFRVYSNIGALFGFLAYYITPKARVTAIDNLKIAFPSLGRREVIKTARKSFSNQGRNLFELLKFPSLDIKIINRLISFPDRQNLDEALKAGKGVLYSTAHFGNWELMGAGLALWGYPINVIARKIYLKYLNTLLVKMRETVGIKVILRSDENSARDVLKALKRNEVIGILIDQDTKVPGVFVDFFGRKAYTTGGLAAIALRSGAAVVTGFMARVGGKHELKVSRPIKLEVTGDKAADVLYNTQVLTKKVEDVIRQYPEQWVWMHKRWRDIKAGQIQ